LRRGVVVRRPALLRPTTKERVLLPSGREEALPEATPRFPRWTGEFPWSTYGGKPILDLDGEPLYAEFVILRLLDAEGWRGVWVNSVHRGPFPTRWTSSPIRIMPPSDLLEAILGGEVALPARHVPEPFVDADDIADVAVAALSEEGHTGKLAENQVH
jgi:hypothetical protein